MQKLAMNKKNNKLIIYFFIIVVVFFLVNLIIRLLLPPQTKINVSDYQFINKDGSKTTFQELNYSGPKIEIPAELSIASIEPNSVSFDKTRDEIIENLSLIKHPEIENIWTTQAWYFSYQPQQNLYTLIDISGSDSPQLKKDLPIGFKNIDELIESSDQQKNNFFSNLDVSAQKDFISFIPDSEEYFSTTDANQATAAIIPYTYTIDSYPLFFEKETNFPFEIIMDSNLNFVKLNYFSLTVKPKIIGKNKTISIEQAIDNIKNKKISSIIAYYQEKGTPLKIEQIETADFSIISIEYRADKQQNLIYPFFKFQGEAKTENDTLWIEVITPAIEINF